MAASAPRSVRQPSVEDGRKPDLRLTLCPGCADPRARSPSPWPPSRPWPARLPHVLRRRRPTSDLPNGLHFHRGRERWRGTTSCRRAIRSGHPADLRDGTARGAWAASARARNRSQTRRACRAPARRQGTRSDADTGRFQPHRRRMPRAADRLTASPGREFEQLACSGHQLCLAAGGGADGDLVAWIQNPLSPARDGIAFPPGSYHRVTASISGPPPGRHRASPATAAMCSRPRT